MLMTVISRDINGKEIKISPLCYAVKNHNYHQFKIMRRNAFNIKSHFLNHARSQKEFFHAKPILNRYKVYQMVRNQFIMGFVDKATLKDCWAREVGYAQSYEMPREMLQVMCGTSNRENGDVWGPTTDFRDIIPAYDEIIFGICTRAGLNGNFCNPYPKDVLGITFAYYNNGELSMSDWNNDCRSQMQAIESYVNQNYNNIRDELAQMEYELGHRNSFSD
jgi:hypothetical protein